MGLQITKTQERYKLWCGAQQTPPLLPPATDLLTPVRCCHLANDNDFLSYMVCDNKQLNLRPADPFTRNDPKLNQVVPWSLHTFPENFMQIGPAVFS